MLNEGGIKNGKRISRQIPDELKARLVTTTQDNHPVNFANRDQDAVAYCKWLDKVEPEYDHFLPTAAQWEYVVRGSEGREFPWVGRWDPDMVVGYHNSPHGTQPVDFAKGATPEGVRDFGNLWELTSTWYGTYNPKDTTDPHGPETGEFAEVRGGSFSSGYADVFRGAGRDHGAPSVRYDRIGFRVARTLRK